MNIVFDLGGVVFQWRPDEIIRRVFDDPHTQSCVRKEIFEHADWVSLDRGTLSFESALDRGESRTGLPRRDIERLLNEVPPSLVPIKETIDLIGELQNTTNRLFVLSNMQRASIAYLEENFDFWARFEGTVISCRVKLVKPEIAIYDYLLKEHQLNATDTVFIDDMPENLEAAASIGIRTIRFLNPDQCRKDLKKILGAEFGG